VEKSFSFKVKEKEITIKLVRDIDILKELKNETLLLKVGFSCDGQDFLEEGEKKLKEKGLAICVVNPAETISSEEIKAILLFENGDKKELVKMKKKDFALKLLEEIELWLKEKHPIQ